MRPLLFKAKLALVGLGIAISTNAAKGVSLHAIAGLDKVFNSCYASYTRSFNCKLHRYEEAVASYDKALQLKSDNPHAWYNRGIALQELQRYSEAIASYDKATQIKPDYFQAWINRGDALENLQRYQEALASYDKALQIGNIPAAWNGRGHSLYELKRYKEAVSSYNKALQLLPNYSSAIEGRQMALRALDAKP